MNAQLDHNYDVIVVGSGHAGCEAALATARRGCRTVLVTTSFDSIALMPCNPSIGGPAKGHLVREIDAMGGEMGRAIDASSIQIRMLNTGKGPAVQAPRAQADKALYRQAMRRALESKPNLALRQGLVRELIVERVSRDGPPAVCGVVTETGETIRGRAVVLTTGTFLRGRIIVGETSYPAGRAGEPPAIELSGSLLSLGLPLRRLKTGTPPRIDARTIDFSQTILQPGSAEPIYFSAAGPALDARPFWPAPSPVYPHPQLDGWRPQMPCYLVHTNYRTHDIIRRNLHRAPLYSGVIEGVGPRYCPSIEDKIVRFADKNAHQIFLEPEGWDTLEVYVQGANTSLPEDVQLAMLRSIPALSRVEMLRTGYAVEYDAVPSSAIDASLETKAVKGLFLAGQINGTSGYEEAAAQGLMAGINSSLKVQGKQPLILRRDQAYIGVLIDDLVTKDITEPYRILTSRAEYRLLLRSDNADLRLTPIAYDLGLVDRERYEIVERKRRLTEQALGTLSRTYLTPSPAMNRALGEQELASIGRPTSATELLRRPDVEFADLLAVLRKGAEAAGIAVPEELLSLSGDVAEQVTVEAKYAGYIEKQRRMVQRITALEEQRLPAGIDYDDVMGLRTEAREKLERFRPLTLGQASRLEGVNPADISVLLIHLARLNSQAA